MLLWLVVGGCTVQLRPCDVDADCSSAFGLGWVCGSSGACETASETTPSDTESSPDTPTAETGIDTTVLILNEVLYDPSNEPADTGQPPPGDANGDGVYVHDEDEFVEFVNLSGATVDVSGYRLYDNEAWSLNEPRHTVPAGTTLRAGEALVVFGGGNVDPLDPRFGGAVVQTASDSPMNLNNATDLLRVTNASGQIIATFDVKARSDDPDESYTRDPDLTGLFEQHATVAPPALFSPGTRTDGTPFR